MVKKVLSRVISNYFHDLETSLKTCVFLIIPFMVFFLVMSDRKPYNYFAFIFYGLESVIIIFYLLRFHSLVLDKYFVLLSTFLLSILLSQIINLSILDYPRTILLLILFSFLFYQFCLTISSLEKEKIFKLIVVGGICFVFYFIIHYFSDLVHFNFSSRLGKDFSDQNDLGKNLGIFAIISEALVFGVKGKKKLFYIFATVFFFFFLLVTGSISNLLVFSLVTIILIIKSLKGKKRLIATIIIIIAIALFIGVLQLPFMSYFKTRIDNMINTISSTSGSVDYSFVDRFNLAIYGLRLFVSKPFFGYGYDQVQFYTFGKNAFSHNNFVELLASFGIVGFIVFESILLYPIFKKRNKGLSGNAVLFSLVYLFAFQFFLIIFRKKIEYFIIPLAFSVIEYENYRGLSFSIKNKKIVMTKLLESKNANLINYYTIDI